MTTLGKIIRGLVIGVVVLALQSCTRPDQARRTLGAAGYEKVEITGYRFFGCSKEDTFHTGFKAVSPTGVPVSGIVCSGFLKGGTIRFD